MRNEVNPHAVAGTDKRREDAYQLIDSGERAHLPMELGIQRRGVLIGNGARVEYKTVAPEKGAERQIGVVEQRIGRDGRGQLAAHGINAPRARLYRVDAGGHGINAPRARLYRVDAGVVQPDPFLVAPVQAHVGCLLLLVTEKVDMAARRSHRRIAETPYQALQTARIERLAHIREEKNLAPRRAQAGVQGRGLSASRHAQEFDALAGESLHDLVGPVG